jgi:hypothetical protein
MRHSPSHPCAQRRATRGALQFGAALAALLLMPAFAAAATIVVDDDGTYDAGTATCDGVDAADTTINAAHAAAIDGDTIFVCPGTYNEAQIDITKAITLQGSGAATTIIDAGGGNIATAGTIRVRTTTGDVKVDGFTIQNPAYQGANPTTGLRLGISSKSSAAVTFTYSNNVIKGTNNPAATQDYGVYTDGPAALETFVFQYNTITETGSNPILIERHTGPTDVSFNTFDRGISQNGVSAYFNMSHSGTAVTSLQRVSNNTINLANDPGPYVVGNASGAISFSAAFTGTTLGTFSNVEITGNVITGVQAFRRGITLSNGATAATPTNGQITNAVVSCNTISGPGTPQTSSFGIRTLGLIVDPDISNNAIDSVETGYTGRVQNTHTPSGVVLEENSFSNVVNAIDWWSSVSLDAETNWFGDASGPTEPTGNPGGTGAAIVATGGPAIGAPVVDYIPWLGTGNDADAGTCFVPGDSGECTGPSTCDPVNGCSAAPTNDGGSCDDGLFCNGADTCNAGACDQHAGDPCTGGADCQNVCDEGADSCNTPASTSCTDDGNACSTDVCDGSGACTHPAGNAGAVCDPASGVCEQDAVCDGVTTVCPANPTLPDADNDGDCDAIDTCTTLDAGQTFSTKPKSRVVLSKINTETVPGNDSLVISAFFALPPGRSFAEIDPVNEGVRVVLLADDGTTRVDAVVPGGAYSTVTKKGWKLSGNGKTWTFVDKGASPANGISQVVINDKNTTKTPRRVKITVKGKKSTYPVVTADSPIQAVVTLGDAAAAAQGLCGESAYTAPDCRFNAPQNKLTCRR